MNSSYQRHLPIGAEIVPEGGVHFRVWAPEHQQVQVVFSKKNQAVFLDKEENGYFSGLIPLAEENDFYQFRLGEINDVYPDPASRYQPQGPHGPSQIIDPSKFQWTDQAWQGISHQLSVLYEMHIGTFTPTGTWEAAKQQLLELSDLGITIIEMMPVNEFPGQFGWGYDGVNLFAPMHVYGQPDDLRRFIDYAHAVGIAVILDVVYNHFGPDGNYMHQFSKHYFTHRHVTEWGDAINFDSEGCESVREFYITNAAYWIEEFHFDGLRLDATQVILDDSPIHILTEIGAVVRQKAGTRQTYVIAENEKQETKIVRPIEEGGYGLDALWNDDFHHSAIVRLTGRRDAYYTDYLGTVQEFVSALKYGYLFQGQWYVWQNKRRGQASFGLNAASFINFIQNHDQIANSAHGYRIHQLTDLGNYRAMTALLLLAPATPMLFQGQEFAASTPFYYFADHLPELSELVFKGRKEFFKQFATIATPEISAALPPPNAVQTFEACKLQLSERTKHGHIYDLHRDLLKLRRHDPLFHPTYTNYLDGAVLNADAFIIRYFNDIDDTRLLIVNFGVDFILSPAPEPLLAPPIDTEWDILWSSENPRYSGGGTPPIVTDNHWTILGHAAIVLIPKAIQKTDKKT